MTHVRLALTRISSLCLGLTWGTVPQALDWNSDIDTGDIDILRDINTEFLSNWKEYYHSNSFPFNYKLNGILFGYNNQKENSHYDHISSNLKIIWNLYIWMCMHRYNFHFVPFSTKSAVLYPQPYTYKFIHVWAIWLVLYMCLYFVEAIGFFPRRSCM